VAFCPSGWYSGTGVRNCFSPQFTSPCLWHLTPSETELPRDASVLVLACLCRCLYKRLDLVNRLSYSWYADDRGHGLLFRILNGGLFLFCSIHQVTAETHEAVSGFGWGWSWIRNINRFIFLVDRMFEGILCMQVLGTAVAIASFFCYHVYYLAFIKFDYGYNMKANIVIGKAGSQQFTQTKMILMRTLFLQVSWMH